MFATVPDAAWPGSDQWPWGTAPAAGPVGRLGRPSGPTHGVLVLSCPSAYLRVHVCAASWATWLLFTGVPAWCVALLVRCPGPLGSCSPVSPLCPLLCMCGVLGHLAPVHRCARSVWCLCVRCSWATWLLFPGVPAWCVVLLSAVSWATRLPFTGVTAWCAVLLVQCPEPLRSCSPMCLLSALCCLCGVLGHLAPVQRCARSDFCVACAVSWATWLLFTGVPARCAVLRVRCPGPLGSCSPVCLLGALLHVCGVLGHLAPVHRCARSLCYVVCAVSWATWLLFTDVPARCVVLRVPCPGPLGSCSPGCLLRALLRVCGVLGHPAPVHRRARSVCCVTCAVSWATWLLFSGVPARCAVLCVRCPGPLGSCSPMCLLGALFCVCCVLGHLAPVHHVPARCVALLLRCPGPPGSCLPVCPLGVLCCVCGVLGPLASVHLCARPVCCAVSWAT